jgi:hypothetical protein
MWLKMSVAADDMRVAQPEWRQPRLPLSSWANGDLTKVKACGRVTANRLRVLSSWRNTGDCR